MDIMEQAAEGLMGSPAYIFDLDEFGACCGKVKKYLGDIPLAFSMKANPFLLNGIPKEVSHIEVCSPGELEICRKMRIKPDQIIYSGVTKEAWDVEKAVAYGVDLLTAESLLHVKLENDAVLKLRTDPQERRRVLLRLTSGNQFGMSEDDIETVIRCRDRYPGLEIYGIHYYSGTQKKMRQIKKDFQRLEHLLTLLKDTYGFEPALVEYGPGASADYFDEPCEETDWAHFEEVAAQIREFAKTYSTGIEMGRFLAAGCGHYLTCIKDNKVNNDTNYLICDGGIHHLKYYGQTMAMQVPPMDVIRKDGAVSTPDEGDSTAPRVPYMLCGSLCTTADILTREVMLPEMQIGDYLLFHRCGAYSVTEGSLLFLSRTMPRIFLYTAENGLTMARDFIETSDLNRAGECIWI